MPVDPWKDLSMIIHTVQSADSESDVIKWNQMSQVLTTPLSLAFCVSVSIMFNLFLLPHMMPRKHHSQTWPRVSGAQHVSFESSYSDFTMGAYNQPWWKYLHHWGWCFLNILESGVTYLPVCIIYCSSTVTEWTGILLVFLRLIYFYLKSSLQRDSLLKWLELSQSTAS